MNARLLAGLALLPMLAKAQAATDAPPVDIPLWQRLPITVTGGVSSFGELYHHGGQSVARRPA